MNSVDVLYDVQIAYQRKVFFVMEHIAIARSVQRRMRESIANMDIIRAKQMAHLGAAMLKVLVDDEMDLSALRDRLRKMRGAVR